MSRAAALLFAIADVAFCAGPFSFDPRVTVDQIDAYLTKRRSRMAGIGADFSRAGQTYDVDPRLLIAISGAETTFGRHLCAANNAWNWFHRGSCPPSTFPTFQEGLGTVTKFLRKSYINRGYNTIPRIRARYCATGCENWIPLVTRFYGEMGGSASIPAPAPASPRSAPSGAVPTASTPVSKQTRRELFGIPAYLLFFGGAIAAGLANWFLLRRSNRGRT